ncbi:MAG: tRNA threonylcarbamoyladenosine dehydratase [Clostridia bacterium]|nr:tRNA threonylcarbamoyladenosine dehydratase [Clostridia bacterium]
MEKAFLRTQNLIGEKGLNKLQNARIAVFGVGGVGGFTAEALVRSGVGILTVIDGDVVEQSNINRQIIATSQTVGKDKVSVIKERLLSINPNAQINAVKLFYLPQTADQIDLTEFDYIVDAIDTVTAKIDLIKRATEKNVPIISCMGTAGKTDLTKLMVTDITKTQGCPLARVMRRELKNAGVGKLKVVFSNEQSQKNESEQVEKRNSGRECPPSMIFVPASAGLLLAQEVVSDLIKGD